MRAKLMLLIASGAAVSVGLLVVRQQRLQAVYEMTRALERSEEHDRSLWQVRADIAEAVRPETVRQMMLALGPMSPIPRHLAPVQFAGNKESKRLRQISHANTDERFAAEASSSAEQAPPAPAGSRQR